MDTDDCSLVCRPPLIARPLRGPNLFLVCGLALLWAGEAGAQTLPPVFDPTGKSGSPPPLEKEKPLEPKPAPILPPVPPPRAPAEEKGPLIRVFVREVRLVGNTVFTAAQLAEVTAPYTNRELTTEDLESLRLALTVFYINKGYVTSGARIPDQRVDDGIVTIEIVEGVLTRIEIEGLRWFRASYLEKRIALGAGPPLNIGPLQERLQLLQQDPRIQRLNAELLPGLKPGESELRVRVQEHRPYHAWLDFDNHQTPVVGAERGLATIAHDNLTGNGDAFSFQYGRSSGVNPIINSSYRLPVNRYDTTLVGEYRRNDFLVIEQPFKPLDITVDVEIIGVSIRQPIVKTLTRDFTIGLTGEHIYNKTFLLGETFDLIPGSQNGVANVTAVRFFQEYVQRDESSVFSVYSRFSLGLDALGATINSAEDVPDGQFFSWLGQIQWAKRFDRWRGIQLIGRLGAQLSNDLLYPLEQMSVGGRFSVRGYRENALIRDNAVLASLEARIPVYRSSLGETVLELAPFTDFGNGWLAKGAEALKTQDMLASVGLGLRWNILPQERARFEVYWGQKLNYVATLDANNLQDYGIHLQLVVQAF
jgi:hemolysin activation/secretion protein